MQIYSFDPAAGKSITAYDSKFIISRIVRTPEPAFIGCMHLETDGVIGRHAAPVPQLLLIVSGEGQVTGNEGITASVYPGDAVFWERDEWHETRTTVGMTAIVIESGALNPGDLMQLKVNGK
ncbi:cupin domain-containing protein [Paenibacillus tengchongensis]|uniref:cupin domain-containing protein n=1 Tax=Paenibacillus tengchongensis TaxID=2608684 RepID=UPI00124E283D|nr:cupin domain-containing protein [Paenibacillus tengchongensis]